MQVKGSTYLRITAACTFISGFSILILCMFHLILALEEETNFYLHDQHCQPAQEIRLMLPWSQACFYNLQAMHKFTRVIEFVTLIQLNTFSNSLKLLPAPHFPFLPLFFPLLLKLVKIQPLILCSCQRASLSVILHYALPLSQL